VYRCLAIVVGVVMLAQACGAGWHRLNELGTGALEPRQQAEVWRAGRALRWHALLINADSVSGIPFHRPVDCDSCRVAVPRASIDSLRLGDPVAAFWKSAGLVAGALLAGCLAFCPREMN